MKTSDIKPGTAYAYAVWANMRDKYMERVVVADVEPGFVTIEGKPEKISVRSLIRTWDEHVERLNDAANERAERVNRMKAARATLEEILPETFFDNGRRPDADYDEEPGVLSYRFDAEVCGDGSFSTEDRISIFDLADIVKAAYEAGRASV